MRAASLGSPVVNRTVPPWAAWARSRPCSQRLSRAESPSARVVEHEGVRIGEQGAGQAEAAVHAERERAEAFVAQADQADDFEDFVGAPGRDARGGAQHAELAADRARRMARDLAEEHADLAGRDGRCGAGGGLGSR